MLRGVREDVTSLRARPLSKLRLDIFGTGFPAAERRRLASEAVSETLKNRMFFYELTRTYLQRFRKRLAA